MTSQHGLHTAQHTTSKQPSVVVKPGYSLSCHIESIHFDIVCLHYFLSSYSKRTI